MIARGDEDAEMIYESSDFLAFVPLNPATTGHTLVIPRQHALDLWSLPGHLIGPLFETAVKVGGAIRAALQPEGMNIIHSSGKAATQTVFHLHIHVVPRWGTDAVDDFWPEPSEGPSEWEQDKAVRAIRHQLG
jgi:histidine triad (HIT) family protein